MKKYFKNQVVIVVLSVLAIFAVVLVFFLSRRPADPTSQDQPATNADNQYQLPPDTDVVIEKLANNSINLLVSNIPESTDSIEYEITYNTKDGVTQGVIGTITDVVADNLKKEIFLGTCSSGSCVTHTVKDKISVLLRFTGGYGSGVLEKEFDYNSL
ncbi:MAG: hypothetical protein KatS3mg091_852 [Patescibacteria group bacterium]|nr:MAG: hypothetical protein KatS3mg090_0985 [Patescibacteria group bacterium]GIW63740.1 MAG: hypothetical protein KatS3mg091_542 [Patescibacteria group bacterium]GIW64050.1 MAG: hypothetical protein KatS3mg091_852 [Patescibacteria group bacterium]